MSYLLPHLHSGFAVDQAILSVRVVRCSFSQPAARLPSTSHIICTKVALLTALSVQEEGRVVCMRFGHDYDQTCMQMDEACSCPLFVH